MTTYARLVSEATDRTGIADIVADVDILIPMAEAQLNRELRVGAMETTVTLTTDATGFADLPADFLMDRYTARGTCAVRKRPLSTMKQGARDGYTITGARFLGGFSAAEYELTYYAALPSLTTAGTNWLLTSNFECYLYALMFQALSRAGQLEAADIARQYGAGLVGQINAQDARARFKGMTMQTAGATP